MGSRGQVFIEDSGVYLYTHWGAPELPANVIEALTSEVGHSRWNDEEYLARIIFDVMLKGNHGTETGFGIGTGVHGDIEVLVTVNCSAQTLTVAELYSDEESFKFEDLYAERFEEIRDAALAGNES